MWYVLMVCFVGLERSSMRWDEVCVSYAVKSEQSRVSEKHLAFQAYFLAMRNAAWHTGNTVIPCLQNRINELQWSVSSAKSTSCRFWWARVKSFHPQLVCAKLSAFCISCFLCYFCSSSFCVSEMCLRERLDSGCSVQYSSSAVFKGWRCSLNNVHGLIIL